MRKARSQLLDVPVLDSYCSERDCLFFCQVNTNEFYSRQKSHVVYGIFL